MTSDKANKNYGIYLLKIYAVFCVLILHCLGHGGILQNAVIDSSQYKFSWLIEIIAYPAVNIFALISGYIYYKNEKVKNILSNVFKLWIVIVFYGMLITVIFHLFTETNITYSDYLMNLFPIANNLYWYFTAYVGLAIIMPIIVKGLEQIDERTAKKIFWAIIILSSFDRFFDVFVLKIGYSFIWLTLLFILGAIIKKCNIGKNIKNMYLILIVFFLFLITYLYKIYGWEFTIFKSSIIKNLLVDYTSPTILINSILLLILFSRFEFCSKISSSIGFLSSSVFWVYIINENRFIRDDIIVNMFAEFAQSTNLTIFLKVFGFSVAFLVLAILIDKIRMLIFEKIGINKLINKISIVFDK